MTPPFKPIADRQAAAPLDGERDSPHGQAVVEVRQVSKAFGKLRAVDNLSLTIPRGIFLAVLGPNGAGKTTLIEMIEGIQAPSAGEIRIFGRTWKQARRELYGRLGVALQETQFMDRLTAEEILDLFGSFYNRRRDRTNQVLQLVGLEDKRRTYAKDLSGGQRQRLVLGVALINEPEILLLDEPTTGLDPNARRDIWRILLQLKRAGATMVLTTHYMEEAQVLCDQILIMHQGKVLAAGTLAQLLAQYDCQELIEFTADHADCPAVLRALPGFKSYESLPRVPNGFRHRIVTENIFQSLPAFCHSVKSENLNIRDVECRKMTLDDLFVSLAGRQLDDGAS